MKKKLFKLMSVGFSLTLLASMTTFATQNEEKVVATSSTAIVETTAFSARIDTNNISVSTYEQLVQAINNVSYNGSIWITQDINFPQSIDLGRKGVTIIGSNSNVTLTCSVGKHFTSTGSYSIKLSNLTLDGQSQGGGIEKSTSTTLDNVHIKNCFTNSGGIVSGNSTTVNNGSFHDNRAATGVIQGNGFIDFTGGEFYNNQTQKGGVISGNGIITLTDSIFHNNEAVDGGVVSGNGFITINRGEFYQNKATSGGVVSGNGPITVTDGKFYENKATNGGVISGNGPINVKNGEFYQNTALEQGGVISGRGSITVEGGNIHGNKASSGGGISGGSIYSQVKVTGHTIIADNISDQAYYMTDANDIATHNLNIAPTVTWTAGFEYAYNNHDIGYTKGNPNLPNEKKHNVTVVIKYLDNTIAEQSQVYQVEAGSRFSENFTVQDNYHLYNTEILNTQGLAVDMINKIVSLDSVDQDYTIILEFEKTAAQKHKVTVITSYLDGALAEYSETYEVETGTPFSESFAVLDDYHLYNTEILNTQGLAVDMINKIVSLDSVNQDYTITLTFEKIKAIQKHNITVITRYLDGILPEHIDTYEVDHGSSFLKPFDVLDGYDLYNYMLRSHPILNVNMDSKEVSLDIVEQDYTIELEFDRADYRIQLTTRYLDDYHPEVTVADRIYYHDNFIWTYEIAEGYQITNLSLIQLPANVIVNEANKTVSIINVDRNYDIVLEFEKASPHDVIVRLIYENNPYLDETSTFTVPHGERFETDLTLEQGYAIKNSTFNASGVSVNRSKQKITIERVTSPVEIDIQVR